MTASVNPAANLPGNIIGEATLVDSKYRFEPLLTEEQVREAMQRLNDWLPIYRLAIFTLTKDSERLAKIVSDEKGANSIIDLWESIAEFQEWRKADDQLIDNAYARISLALMQSDWYQAPAAGEAANG